MIVDDNATQRRILMEMLRIWQMRPSCAATGHEALSILLGAAESREPFALVVLDADMPEIDGFELARRIRSSPLLSQTSVIMLISAARQGDPGRCRDLGICAYLTKPLRRADLRTAIAAILSGASPQPAGAIASDAVPQRAALPLRILLAEDNLVNQRIALGILGKHGHSVVVANNGVEALTALAEQPFDLILMDVQMPEMDGLETAQAIRRREQGGATHIPIVAMTAHAMSGDRKRCLAAGMDEYLAKPIRVAELLDVLAKHQPGGVSSP